MTEGRSRFLFTKMLQILEDLADEVEDLAWPTMSWKITSRKLT